MSTFTHIDKEGRVRMVDVTGKKPTLRVAVAQAVVSMNPDTFKKIQNQTVKKGNVLETARIAGIVAAKRTPDIIPLCHSLPLDHVDVECAVEDQDVRIRATAKSTAKTGVEMESLVAAAVAALTVYDMCKSAGKGIEILSVRLLEKSGGKSGTWKRE